MQEMSFSHFLDPFLPGGLWGSSSLWVESLEILFRFVHFDLIHSMSVMSDLGPPLMSRDDAPLCFVRTYTWRFS